MHLEENTEQMSVLFLQSVPSELLTDTPLKATNDACDDGKFKQCRDALAKDIGLSAFPKTEEEFARYLHGYVTTKDRFTTFCKSVPTYVFLGQ